MPKNKTSSVTVTIVPKNPPKKKQRRDRYAGATVVTTVSMHGATKDATQRIADKLGLGVSELVRVAIGAYAAEHGCEDEVQHFLKES